MGRRGEGGAGSGPMDGQLFQVGQLLAVREGIAPFQADFTAVDRVLDFSHLQDHLRRIALGPAALFSLSADNAMLQLVSRGGPRVLESQVPPPPSPPPTLGLSLNPAAAPNLPPSTCEGHDAEAVKTLEGDGRCCCCCIRWPVQVAKFSLQFGAHVVRESAYCNCSC